MIPFWVDAVYAVSQGFIFLRTVYQVHASSKEKRSITPMPYWFFTIISSALTIVYGILIGSWTVPIITLIGYPFIFMNIKIEQTRGKKDQIFCMCGHQVVQMNSKDKRVWHITQGKFLTKQCQAWRCKCRWATLKEESEK